MGDVCKKKRVDRPGFHRFTRVLPVFRFRMKRFEVRILSPSTRVFPFTYSLPGLSALYVKVSTLFLSVKYALKINLAKHLLQAAADACPVWIRHSIFTFFSFLTASSVFGMRISRTPSLNCAFALSDCTSAGKVKLREKEPYEHSHLW